MTTHTPGPWVWDEENTDGRMKWYVRDTDTEGRAFGRAVCKVTGRKPNSEARANARLIAAAPDLLAALHGFDIVYCDHCGATGEDPFQDESACPECGGCGEQLRGGWIPDIRAAIAKVEGR